MFGNRAKLTKGTEKIEKEEENTKGSSPDLRSKSVKEDQNSNAKVPIRMKPLERKLTGWAEHTWSTFIKRAEEEEAVAPKASSSSQPSSRSSLSTSSTMSLISTGITSSPRRTSTISMTG